MELTEALVTEDITPFERQRLREALEEERNILTELWQRGPAFHASDSALAVAFMGPDQLLN